MRSVYKLGVAYNLIFKYVLWNNKLPRLKLIAHQHFGFTIITLGITHTQSNTTKNEISCPIIVLFPLSNTLQITHNYIHLLITINSYNTYPNNKSTMFDWFVCCWFLNGLFFSPLNSCSICLKIGVVCCCFFVCLFI